MTTPNLFDYATSELSQDAFLAWLLSWADESCQPSDAAIHEVAVRFVRALLTAAGIEPPAKPFTVQVERQADRIDVVARIDRTHAIVIEDKVHTREHSNQLARYRERFEEENPDLEVAFVYLKTGDQASFASVDESGWAVFLRRDLLEVLSTGSDCVTNAIFVDYLDYLKRLDAAANSFQTVGPENWGRIVGAWGGFFTRLQASIEDGRWGYVANPSGGFMGFWWGWHEFEAMRVYLQLEEQRLTVRIALDDDDEDDKTRRRRALRGEWSKRILDIESPRFRRPARFGSGSTMTVAVLDGDYLALTADGRVDVERTVEVLERVERAVSAVVEQSTVPAT